MGKKLKLQLIPKATYTHHSDWSLIEVLYRADSLWRAPNYLEVSEKADGYISDENQYNFGIQNPRPGVYDSPLADKHVMLISQGEGKSIDEELVKGTVNHAHAHTLYSGWNAMAMLSLRLVQGKGGIYYCHVPIGQLREIVMICNSCQG